MREREDGDPPEVDLNSSLRCLVSLLLDKVIRHQKVFSICFVALVFVYAPRRTFKVIGTKLGRPRAIDGLPERRPSYVVSL